jgi:hypothetical protein
LSELRNKAGINFIFLAVIFFIIAAAMVLYGFSRGISWAGLRPSPCYPGCFCEAFQRGAILQPLSSYSNLWYILAGLGIIALTKINLPGDDRRTNLFLRQPSYVITFGIVAIAVGLTSFFYHVSLTLVGRWVDYMGMYAFAGFAVVYNLARLRIVHGRSFAITYAALNVGLAIPMVAISSLNVKRALLTGTIVAMLALEGVIYYVRRPRQLHWVYLITALCVMAAATGANLLDESGRWCSHSSLWQWHAVWHFLTAVTISLLFLYYRTEDDRERHPASK